MKKLSTTWKFISLTHFTDVDDQTCHKAEVFILRPCFAEYVVFHVHGVLLGRDVWRTYRFVSGQQQQMNKDSRKISKILTFYSRRTVGKMGCAMNCLLPWLEWWEVAKKLEMSGSSANYFISFRYAFRKQRHLNITEPCVFFCRWPIFLKLWMLIGLI